MARSLKTEPFGVQVNFTSLPFLKKPKAQAVLRGVPLWSFDSLSELMRCPSVYRTSVGWMPFYITAPFYWHLTHTGFLISSLVFVYWHTRRGVKVDSSISSLRPSKTQCFVHVLGRTFGGSFFICNNTNSKRNFNSMYVFYIIWGYIWYIYNI